MIPDLFKYGIEMILESKKVCTLAHAMYDNGGGSNMLFLVLHLSILSIGNIYCI